MSNEQKIYKPKEFKFGAMGDTHLASNYEHLTALNEFYDELADRGVTKVFHTGNYLEGEAPFNKNEVKAFGFEGQAGYFVVNYPKRTGINTYYIDAHEHEGWYRNREGISVGKRVEQTARDAGRTDLHWLGEIEADMVLPLAGGDVVIRLLHPGGGSKTSVSLAGQQIVDSYADKDRPHILLVGHFHKCDYLPEYRNVHIIQTGSFQQQSMFMRLKNLRAAVGGWVVSITHSSEGRLRVSAEYLHYASKIWSPRKTHIMEV